MDVHPNATIVTKTIPFVDRQGTPVTPTAASMRVLDQTGAELIAATPVSFTPGDTEVDVEVSAATNVLSGVEREIRTIELTMVTSAGPIRTLTRYMLDTERLLHVPLNSFQTFEEAMLEAANMPEMSGWMIGDEESRVKALIEAFSRLVRMSYAVSLNSIESQSRMLNAPDLLVSPITWRELTETEFRDWPDHFRRALRRAQIAESDVILNGDVIAGRRRSGLMSESIGESSMMFRPGIPLDLGVSEQALIHLSGYIRIYKRIGRA